ncbi:MAG: NAD(P)H-hydrate dehydratase [Methylococcaceae bacterium]|nr:NAD(P)H-hydrate dehydratase [Methylococcaceae bacterium]
MSPLPNKLYLAEQVREMDRMAIEDYAIPGIDLMRKAGQVVFELIQQQYADDAIVIFCGAGNNAGDGYVIAKLAIQADLNVKVYFLSAPEKLKGDAYTAYQDYIQAGGQAIAFSPDLDLVDCVLIDALLGTGLNRQVSGLYAEAITLINNGCCSVVSVDIPSGLNADTGKLMGCAVKAQWTVSFIGLKQGMFTGFAAEYCGTIIYSSLDIPDTIFQKLTCASQLMQQPTIAQRHRCAHKGSHGHVLVVGGDAGFSGAIKLAAEAALRTGAGLVSVATRASHSAYINMLRPELMCHGVESKNDLTPLLNKATVVVIGPGLAQSAWAKELFQCVVDSGKPLVIDADGLNLLAKASLHQDNWVLTPHPGEAARLLACSTEHIAEDRFFAVSQIQKKYGGVVVLKGAGTLIDNADGIVISTTGNPGMASGGMGDVLAGMIAGLVAQKMPLSQAAKMAVYLHGEAADLSAQQQGERGLLASDLMPFIRKLINR